MSLEGDRLPGDESVAAWQNYVPEKGGLNNTLGAAMPELDDAAVIDEKKEELPADGAEAPIQLTIHVTPGNPGNRVYIEGSDVQLRPYYQD